MCRNNSGERRCCAGKINLALRKGRISALHVFIVFAHCYHRQDVSRSLAFPGAMKQQWRHWPRRKLRTLTETVTCVKQRAALFICILFLMWWRLLFLLIAYIQLIRDRHLCLHVSVYPLVIIDICSCFTVSLNLESNPAAWPNVKKYL